MALEIVDDISILAHVLPHHSRLKAEGCQGSVGATNSSQHHRNLTIARHLKSNCSSPIEAPPAKCC